MSDTIDRTPDAGARPPRWTRTHTVWTLIALSLLPGAAAGVAREWWHQLPAGIRLSAYILSGILLVSACSFLVLPDGAGRDDKGT